MPGLTRYADGRPPARRPRQRNAADLRRNWLEREGVRPEYSEIVEQQIAGSADATGALERLRAENPALFLRSRVDSGRPHVRPEQVVSADDLRPEDLDSETMDRLLDGRLGIRTVLERRQAPNPAGSVLGDPDGRAPRRFSAP